MNEDEFRTGKKPQKEPKASSLDALKDFKFQFDETQVVIAEGDDVSKLNLPKWVIQNLITENVLKG